MATSCARKAFVPTTRGQGTQPDDYQRRKKNNAFLQSLWIEGIQPQRKCEPKAQSKDSAPLVNIIGPAYGYFNTASDLAEI